MLHLENVESLSPGRALGVRAARAPIVAFGESHAIPQPGWARGSGRLADDLGFHRRLPARVRTALAGEPRGRAAALAALLALWQAAYAAGFAAEAAAGLSRAAPRARRRAAGA